MNIISENYITENTKIIYSFSDKMDLAVIEPSTTFYCVKEESAELFGRLNKIKNLHSKYIADIKFIINDAERLKVYYTYISGNSLKEVLKKGTLDERTALSYALDIARGLKALHSVGIIHRDINPNNIIISEGSGAKIIDFGTVREYTSGKSEDTHILGTVGFAAPEQFGFTQSDERTDIYSLGVLLNVMLTGKFPGEKLWTGKCKKIIKKCIELDSKKRFKDADDLIEELENALENKSFEYFFRELPGFRSNKKAVNVISAVLYFLFFALWLLLFIGSGDLRNRLALIFGLTPAAVLPFVFISNMYGIQQKAFPGTNKWVRRIITIILSLLICFVFLIIFGLIAPENTKQ